MISFFLCCNFLHDDKQASAGPHSLKSISYLWDKVLTEEISLNILTYVSLQQWTASGSAQVGVLPADQGRSPFFSTKHWWDTFEVLSPFLHFSTLLYKREMDILEQVQQRATNVQLNGSTWFNTWKRVWDLDSSSWLLFIKKSGDIFFAHSHFLLISQNVMYHSD